MQKVELNIENTQLTPRNGNSFRIFREELSRLGEAVNGMTIYNQSINWHGGGWSESGEVISKVEIVTTDDLVKMIKDEFGRILAQSRLVGKIFTTPIEEAIRIRTEETGDDALSAEKIF